MGECEYGKGKRRVEYYDYENKKVIPYECPRNALVDKHYCEFHDNEYAQNNPDEVINSFYTLVLLSNMSRSMENKALSFQLRKRSNAYKYYNLSWTDYERRFISEMRNNPKAMELIRWLSSFERNDNNNNNNNETVTLICFCPKEEFCHRSLVKRMALECLQ
jgi:uncharacterized protein DUF488